MTQSYAHQPDLDWSQVRETVKLLALSATHVEGSMVEGDDSVTVLTESFTAMVEHLAGINAQLELLEPSEAKDLALAHCSATSDKIRTSIVAFQFYDRLQQRLQHVTFSLKALSDIVESPERLYNPREWAKLQEQIRSTYTMESEKALFDAIVSGKSIEEALKIAAYEEQNTNEDEDIELF